MDLLAHLDPLVFEVREREIVDDGAFASARAVDGVDDLDSLVRLRSCWPLA